MSLFKDFNISSFKKPLIIVKIVIIEKLVSPTKAKRHKFSPKLPENKLFKYQPEKIIKTHKTNRMNFK